MWPSFRFYTFRSFFFSWGVDISFLNVQAKSLVKKKKICRNWSRKKPFDSIEFLMKCHRKYSSSSSDGWGGMIPRMKKKKKNCSNPQKKRVVFHHSDYWSKQLPREKEERNTNNWSASFKNEKKKKCLTIRLCFISPDTKHFWFEHLTLCAKNVSANNVCQWFFFRFSFGKWIWMSFVPLIAHSIVGSSTKSIALKKKAAAI